MTKSTPEYLQCVQCATAYQWIYNEECPKCKHDVEGTLAEYHKQMAIIKQQHAEHSISNDYGIDDYTDYYPGADRDTTISERLGMDGKTDAELADMMED